MDAKEKNDLDMLTAIKLIKNEFAIPVIARNITPPI